MTADAIAGARNLLVDCAQAKPGDRVLIAFEPPSFGYYEADALECLVAAARAIGTEVTTLDVGFEPEAPRLTDDLLEAVRAADVIVFLARLGDQLRFSDMPPGKTFVVSFALAGGMFASPFGRADYGFFVKLKKLIDARLAASDSVRITCARGTDVVGRPDIDLAVDGDTTVRRFPMPVFTPVPAHSFSGRVALPGFLTGTGSMYYDPFTIEFAEPLFAILENGRLAGFDGPAAEVRRAEAHYDFVAGRFGIDRDCVHSWHAGIHPGCAFPWPARESYERWSGAAFGNPRVLHFHTCGSYPPGEICWNVIDPTVSIDGTALWQDGVLEVERVPGASELLAAHPGIAALFAAPSRQIGID